MTKEELIQKLHESAEEIDERVTYNGCYEELYGYMFDDIADMVKDSDLVEVVRCKDCRYWETVVKNAEYGLCRGQDMFNNGWQTRERNFYCADGERKNEVNND